MTLPSIYWPFFNKTGYYTKFYTERYDLRQLFILNFRAAVDAIL